MSTIQKLKFRSYETALGTAYRHIMDNGHWLVIRRNHYGTKHYPWILLEFEPGKIDGMAGDRVYLGTGEYAHTKKHLEARAAAYVAGDPNWWKVAA